MFEEFRGVQVHSAGQHRSSLGVEESQETWRPELTREAETSIPPSERAVRISLRAAS